MANDAANMPKFRIGNKYSDPQRPRKGDWNMFNIVSREPSPEYLKNFDQTFTAKKELEGYCNDCGLKDSWCECE